MQLHLGWHAQQDGKSFYGISVENGRLTPALRRAVREAVETLGLRVRLTAAAGSAADGRHGSRRAGGDPRRRGVARPESVSLVRRNAMACPAKPTCGLAMTEAESPAQLDRRDRGGGARRRRRGDPHDGLPQQLRAAAHRRDRHLRLRQERSRAAGRRLARGHAARAPLYARISGQQMIPALVGPSVP